jgi:signal transduction histidine kinase
MVAAVDDGWLQLQVSDDGQGFNPSISSRRKGSVGLDLLAALVHQRGGNLRVESAVGQGTTVTLHLPEHPAGLARGMGPKSKSSR